MKRKMRTLTSAYELSHTLTCKAIKITHKVEVGRREQLEGWRWEDGWKQGQARVSLRPSVKFNKGSTCC